MEILFKNLEMMIAQSNDRNMSRMSWLIRAAFDEMIDELNERETDGIELVMENAGRILKWVGTGDINDLPEDLQPRVPLEMRQPKAIES